MTTYSSWKECIAATGVSREILRAAKAKGAPGFYRESGSTRIKWDDLEPWLKEHQQELETVAENTMEEIKKANAIKTGVLLDLQIAERKGEILNPKEVISFLQSMANAQSVILNTKERELAAKVDANTAKLVSGIFAEVRKLFTTELAKWIDKQKINS